MAVTAETLRLFTDLRATVGQQSDDAVRALAAAWVREWNSQSAGWHEALRDLAALAADLGRWPYAWEQQRVASLHTAVEAAVAALSALGELTTSTVTTAATNVTTATVDAEPYILASQLPAAHRKAPAVLFGAALGATALASLHRRHDNRVAAAVRPLPGATSESLRRVVLAGVPVSADTTTMAGSMLDRVRAAFDGGLTRATNAARTEPVDAYRGASRAVQIANRSAVRGWIWWCECSARSCPACWSMHGTEHPVDESGPDGHGNCRCARLPLLQPWANFGIDLDEPDSPIVAARTRFDLLPEADQLKILGPARLALLRSGAVSWADLAVRRDNPGWRPSYVPRPVSALQSLARANA